MTLKAYLVAWLIRVCYYNNLEWLCEALEIFPRPKQLSSEALDLLKRKIDLLKINLTEPNMTENTPNNLPHVFSAVPVPTIKTLFLLGVLLIWRSAFNWMVSNEKLRRLFKNKGWTLMNKFSPDRSFERSIGAPADSDESSGYRSLDGSDSSFLTAQGFDASFEQILTVGEVLDFESLFNLFDVVTCEKIAENTYFLRCEKERLCLSLIEVSDDQPLNRTYLSDLEFFVKIATDGADYANEAHALDVTEIVAIYDSLDNLNAFNRNRSFDAKRYVAVVHHYEENMDFRHFCKKHPTAAESSLLLEDITTSLRSLVSAAERCGAEIPAQFLIALVRCSHDRREPGYRDRSLTCLNAFGVSIRLNPLCLKVGVPLDELYCSVAYYRHQLETKNRDCLMMETRAIKTCTELLSVLDDLLKSNESVMRNFEPDAEDFDDPESPFHNIFTST